MTSFPDFRPCQADDQPACLALFDANCPEFFDPGERSGYLQFLEAIPVGYEVCLLDGRIAGAYGILPHAPPQGNDAVAMPSAAQHPRRFELPASGR